MRIRDMWKERIIDIIEHPQWWFWFTIFWLQWNCVLSLKCYMAAFVAAWKNNQERTQSFTAMQRYRVALLNMQTFGLIKNRHKFTVFY